MIIRMNRFLGTKFPTEEFDSTVGNDLVHVHVSLSSGAGLEDDEWEMRHELAGYDFIRGSSDSIDDFGVEAWQQDEKACYTGNPGSILRRNMTYHKCR